MAMSDVVRLQDQINLVAATVADCARAVAEIAADMQTRMAAVEKALADAETKPGKR